MKYKYLRSFQNKNVKSIAFEGLFSVIDRSRVRKKIIKNHRRQCFVPCRLLTREMGGYVICLSIFKFIFVWGSKTMFAPCVRQNDLNCQTQLTRVLTPTTLPFLNCYTKCPVKDIIPSQITVWWFANPEQIFTHQRECFHQRNSPIQYPIRRLIVRSHCKISKPRDWLFRLSHRFEIWQAPRQRCCRAACQISE